MKICQAVNVIPPREYGRRESKFLHIFKMLTDVPVSAFLPVQCQYEREAVHLKQECTRRGLVSERRKKIVFIQGCAAVSASTEEVQIAAHA